MIDVNSNAAAVAVRYERAPKIIGSNLVKTFRRIGGALQSFIAREKLSGQVLNARTRTLVRSLFYRIALDAGEKDAVLYLGSDSGKAKYNKAQEYGATITPKRGTFLTIPVGPNLTKRGVARVSAREFINNPGTLGFVREFVNKRKTAILGVDADGHATPVFALKKRVVLPERSYLRSGVRERRAWILEQLGANLLDGVEKPD